MSKRAVNNSKDTPRWARTKALLDPLNVTAFTIGFVLMSYELIAARIMSPVVGASSYVWTSIIGVIIAALALGYYYGGKLADLRVRRSDISGLLMLSAIMMCLTFQTQQSVLSAIQSTQLDLRLQAVIAATVLFLPTSFLLGAISPYLARLRMKSVKTTGQTVAQLSALNSVGGIVGTFSTGFIFFAYLGSKQALLILTAIVLNTAWLTVDKTFIRKHLTAYIIIILVLLLSYPYPTHAYPIVIDTAFAHYQIYAVEYDGHPVKAISTGPRGLQSGVYANGSKDLVFTYTRVTAGVVSKAPIKRNILILGGGAFTLPEYFARQYPDAQVTVVEIDPALPEISRKYLNFTQPQNVRIVSQDARTFIHNDPGSYDVIISDMYNDISIPFSVATQEFTADLAKRLSPGGVVIANLVGSVGDPCGTLFSSIAHSYQTALPVSSFIPLHPQDLSKTQNIIGIFAPAHTSWISGLGNSGQDIVKQPQTLTDNFAPVEKLGAACN